MTGSTEPGFEPEARKRELPSVEELATARQTLAEAREMLEDALLRVAETSEETLAGEGGGLGEAAP